MSNVVNQQFYTLGSGTSSTDPFVTILAHGNPSSSGDFPIGKRWINIDTSIEFIQISPGNWIPINGGSSGILSVTGNSGGAVGADSIHNVNIVGDNTTIRITGTPSTNTLTASLLALGGIALNVQTFYASGTYTPSASMSFAIIEVLGAGGGSGSVTASATTFSIGGAGGGGGYSCGIFSAATIGASQVVTVGAGGSAGTSAGDGGTGGTTSVGSLISATGGAGGIGGSESSTFLAVVGADGGLGSGGYVNSGGQPGTSGFGVDNGTTTNLFCGTGGGSMYGGGGTGKVTNARSTISSGNLSTGFGAGSSGAYSAVGITGAASGITGGDGLVIITEFLT